MNYPDYLPVLIVDGLELGRVWCPGAPHPKDRPRVSTRGGTPRLYTPAETVKAERRVNAALEDGWRGGVLKDVRLAMELLFVMPPPAPRCKLPDVDNLAKLVLDAAHKVVYANDRVVSDLLARRRVRPIAEAGTLIIIGTAP